jgi:hypothetical protein
VFLATNTTSSLLMIAPILCELFLCELNLTPFPPCQFFFAQRLISSVLHHSWGGFTDVLPLHLSTER